MTRIIQGNHKTNNKENKKIDESRPKGHLGDHKTPPKYENFNGEPIE